MSRGGERVAVVGAGWAGLAAAIDLRRAGRDVAVFEAGPAPGGRARPVMVAGRTLDNGQHLLLGAYGSTLDLMRTIGVEPDAVLRRRRLALELDGADTRLSLRLGPGPAPLGLAAGLLTCRGPAAADRLRALVGAPRLRRVPARDIDAAAWLRRCGQPEVLIERLWGPLCLAALNVPPGRASARVLARVLRETFSSRGAADLLLPRSDLGALLPRPAGRWLADNGTEVRCSTRVRRLARDGTGWRLETAGGSERCAHVVLATAPEAAARLLPADESPCRALRHRLGSLGHEPITTVYLDYGPDTSLGHEMSGRLDGPGQWVFDRALTGQPGVMAVVISGSGPHMDWPRERLGRAVTDQLACAHPAWPRPSVLGIVRERRATFDCRPGIARVRVGVRGPLPGLWFGGDHVDTGLPATLEGAVRAGRACAREIISMQEDNE